MASAMSYRIYRNLHSNTWTVQHKVPGVGWRKLESAEALYVPQANFTVSDAGRRRARLEGRKNVHAFAVVESYHHVEQERLGRLIDVMGHNLTYSPFNDRGFTDGLTVNVYRAVACLFAPSGRIWAHKVHGFEQPRLEDELGVMRTTVPDAAFSAV
jgi:hypothetical protein